MLPYGIDVACAGRCRFSASASALNLFFSWRVKFPLALLHQVAIILPCQVHFTSATISGLP